MNSLFQQYKASVVEGIDSLWTPRPHHIPSLDGIRALAFLWVSFFHGLFFQYRLVDFIDVTRDVHWRWLQNGYFGVDIFFVLSGFLIGRILLKQNSASLFNFYARRLIRLWPVYLVVLVVGFFSLGGTKSSKVWVNAIFLNNFLPSNDHFMSWTWSIAAEVQFYLLCPLLLFVVSKIKKGRAFGVGGLFLLLWSIRIGLKEMNGIPFGFIFPGDPKFELLFDKYYIKPYGRYGCFLIGVLVAWVHFFHKDRLDLIFEKKSIVVRLFFGAATLLLVGMAFSPVPQYEDWYRFVLFATKHDLVGLSIGMIILCVLHAPESTLRFGRSILRHRFFVPFARISYGGYLVHSLVLLKIIGPIESYLSPTFAKHEIFIVNFVFGFVVACVIAGFLYIFIEIPCQNMSKKFLNYRSKLPKYDCV